LNIPRLHTICVAGATAEVSARITTLLDEQRTKLEARWRPGDFNTADLLLVEADSVYGHMDWLKAQGNGRLVAALTGTPDAYDRDFSLRLPIVAAELIALLNRASAQINGLSAAAAPAPAAAAPSPVAPTARPAAEPAPRAAVAPRTPIAPPPLLKPAAPVVSAPAPVATTNEALRPMQLAQFLGPNPPLIGRLRLQSGSLPDLFINTHDQSWHSAGNLKNIAPWCTRSLSHLDVQMVSENEYTGYTSALPAQPGARLKWLVHLSNSDGQLENGLDPKARYKLSRWPQSERDFPKHFRIATVMLKQASTLEEIAAQGGATVADVANFINAYNALGYIESDEAARAQTDSRGGGLFGRAKKTSAMS
jgi:hypothetical protein